MNSQPSKMNHIPEIEGLRGLSILLVVLFHLNEDLLPGGFLGVDVFFVISGYLITTFIKLQFENGDFSFATFYMRRVRRLAPAMVATLLLTILVSAMLLSPNLMEDFSQSALATLASVSNIYFWNQVGYWETAGHLKPLLHTWSLGVEEQFYLIWPLVLVALIIPLQKQAGRILIFGIAVSLLIIELLSFPSETLFYLLPFRFFEFFVGALPVVANLNHFKFIERVSQFYRTNPFFYDVLVMAAFTAVGACALIFDEETHHPSFLTLIPCIGAILLIVCAPKARLGILLKNRIITYIGSISYSLYLIHWPVIIFYRHYAFGPTESLIPLTSNEQIALALIAFVLAGLMHRYVERPFRNRTFGVFSIPSKRVLVHMGGAAIAIIVLAGSASLYNGWTWRIPAERLAAVQSAQEMAVSFDTNAHLASNCTWVRPLYNGLTRFCLFGDTQKIKGARKGGFINLSEVSYVDYLVIGDSHAKALMSGLDKYFKRTKKSAALLMPAGRLPFAGIQTRQKERIRPPTELIFPLLESLDYSGVLLVGMWSAYFNSGDAQIDTAFDLRPIVWKENNRVVQSVSSGQNERVFLYGLQLTSAFFKNRNVEVFVVGEVPYIGILSVDCISVPSYVISKESLNDRCVGAPMEEVERRLLGAHLALKQFSDTAGFSYVPLLDLMCVDSKCLRIVNGQIMYFDDNHLNELGSTYVVSRFFPPYLE